MPFRALLLVAMLPLAEAGAQAEGLIRRLIERGRHPAIRWARFTDVQAEARRLYADNGWAPLWLEREQATRSARALLDALATAGDRGLASSDYDAVQLGALAANLGRGGGDTEQAARFDAALTVAGLRYLRALARGRAPPPGADSFDAAASLAAFRGNPDPDTFLESLEPPWPHYRALRSALARYRSLERDTALLRLPRPGNRPLGLGARYRGAAALRRLLAALGDLSPDATAPRGGDTLLSAELVDGLYRFQVRHGARVDGSLSDATWRVLTTGLGTSIRKMALGLERWRWLPRDTSASPLFVMLPAGRAHYLVPEGPFEGVSVSLNLLASPALLAGLPAGRSLLTRVVFHPPEGPDKLTIQGADGDRFLYGSSPFDLTSRPNAGRAAQGFWVSDAQLLAELLLHDQAEWTASRIHSTLASRRTLTVPLSKPVQLLIVYATAVARENGQAFFHPDPAGHDRRLEQRLAGGYR